MVMTPEGVGTTAHIVGTFARGMIVEQSEREYTEVAQDERNVTKAHAKVHLAGLPKDVANGPIFTWLFEGDGSTKVSLVVLEEDLNWIQNLLESVSAVAMGKNLHGMLAALKAGVESQTSSAA